MSETDNSKGELSPCCAERVKKAFYGKLICSSCRSEVWDPQNSEPETDQ